MRPRVEPSPRLLSLAAAQAGVVSSEQVLGLGLSRHSVDRLIREGRWQRLATSVYSVQHAPPEWLAYAWAGVLLGGPQSRLGGFTSARLLGLTDAEPRPIVVMVPDASAVRSRAS